MTFIKKLNDTYELLDRLDNMIIKDTAKDILKKQLLSVSRDLEKYKDINDKNIEFENDNIKPKIQDVLNRINEIEINVKNKLIITEKYNAYLNS